MKKFLPIILGIVILGGLGFFYYNSINKKSLEIQNSNINNNSKDISLEELKSHNNKSDCWIAIEGNAYDVTSYISSHPGGLIIANYCGKDATEAFNDRGKGESHSPKARNILNQYFVGQVPELKTNL